MAENEKMTDRRQKAENILADKNKSDDVKLFEIFQLYKDNLREHYAQFYYAMLGWKDAHLKELLAETDIDLDEN